MPMQTADRGSAGSRPVGLGLIGCGHIAGLRHLPALARLRDKIEVVAIADRDRAALDLTGDEHGIERRYEDAAELLADPAVEAVGVLVPAIGHAEVAIAALEAGRHVMVEKPLALSEADCERMVAAAAERPELCAMVAFNLRFHKLVRAGRRAIAAGELGAIDAIGAVVMGTGLEETRPGMVSPWKRDRALGGGALIEKGVHHYDLWRYLSGEEVEQVSAISELEDGYDRRAVVSARMRSGAIASATIGYSTTSSNEISVHGRAARMDISLYAFDGLRMLAAGRYEGALGTRLGWAGSSLRALPGAVRAARGGGDYVGSYAGEWSHFAHCVRGGEVVQSGFADGLAATRIANAAIASADSGSRVTIEPAQR